MKASIKKGQTIPYTTVSANGTQTQLVDADLLLEVTPRIFADGRISMKIKMTDNSPRTSSVNKPPVILTQEAETNMIVKDGETAVIGGIIRNTDQVSRDGWPGLMNIPVVNFFFTNKVKRKSSGRTPGLRNSHNYQTAAPRLLNVAPPHPESPPHASPV